MGVIATSHPTQQLILEGSKNVIDSMKREMNLKISKILFLNKFSHMPVSHMHVVSSV